jgi:Holliday junction resolvasome RuvABC endonuclease subunit
MSRIVKVLGIDPSFANMGFARGAIDIDTMEISIENLLLLKTESQADKDVRKSSDDLRRAKELHSALMQQSKDCALIMAEIPHGSQSARASWALGISVGVLAACPVPIIQLTALQVKMATVGRKQASKAEMIEWAVTKYPSAPWAIRKGVPIQSNEHLADACAVIHAGIEHDQFKQLLALLRVSTAPKRVALK